VVLTRAGPRPCMWDHAESYVTDGTCHAKPRLLKDLPDLFPTPRTSSAPVWCNRITEDAASPADDSATMSLLIFWILRICNAFALATRNKPTLSAVLSVVI
jgi:hypothetical protein